MRQYTFRRVPGGGYDVDHGPGAYDGRFSRAQLVNFMTQEIARGHKWVDGDLRRGTPLPPPEQDEGVHAIYEIESGRWVCDVPYNSLDPKGNHGLPDWFFGHDPVEDTYALDQKYDNIVVHPSGSALWIPAMGPAPCWHAASAGLLPREEMWRQNSAWAKIVYGLEEDTLGVFVPTSYENGDC